MNVRMWMQVPKEARVIGSREAGVRGGYEQTTQVLGVELRPFVRAYMLLIAEPSL